MNGEQLNEPNLEKAFRPIASLHSELNRNFIGNCMARDCGKLGINLSNFPSALSKAEERERGIIAWVADSAPCVVPWQVENGEGRGLGIVGDNMELAQAV